MGEGVTGMLRKVHPRQIIWGLLVALIGLVGFIGKQYDGRLEALEAYKVEQNGHLKKIDTRLEVMDTNVQWIRYTLERRNP